jgi:hypothetical protein
MARNSNGNREGGAMREKISQAFKHVGAALLKTATDLRSNEHIQHAIDRCRATGMAVTHTHSNGWVFTAWADGKGIRWSAANPAGEVIGEGTATERTH